MKEYLSVLKKCPLFAKIAEEDLLPMLGCLGAQVTRYSKRETVLSEGEPFHCIGIVLSGSVQVLRVDFYGNRSIMTEINPGELFGESFACAGVQAIPVDVVANEAAEVMFVNCQRVMGACCNACRFHQQLIYNLMEVMARKNLMFHQKIEITSKRTTREKLIAYLLLQAKQQGRSRFEIPYDRQELADYLEVDRSGLSAEIGKLRKEGVLNSCRSWFELL